MNILKKIKQSSLSQQILVVASIGIIGSTILIALILSWVTRQVSENYLLDQGAQLARELGRQSQLALLYESSENATEVLDTMLTFPDVVSVGIFDLNGNSLVEKGEQIDLSADRRFQIEKVGDAMRETDSHWFFKSDVMLSEFSSDLDAGSDESEKIGTVRVVMSKEALKASIAGLVFIEFTVSLGLAAVLLFFLFQATRVISRPLNDLSSIMDRSQQGHKGLRASVNGASEIRRIAASFNKLIDVVERREVEIKQARDIALDSARVKSDFAANVSHELRTPLNSILGMLELLQHSEMQMRNQEYLRIAHQSSTNLLRLINDILDFSKIEAGKKELVTEAFDLRDLIENLIEMLAGQALNKGVNIGHWIPPELSTELYGYATGIQQILTNLIGNAIKFTDSGDISVFVSAIASQEEQITLRFEVRDTGVGIPIDDQKNVFESFSQSNSSTTHKSSGTGLGLSIAERLVKLMDGDIGLASAEGEGSVFWFTANVQVRSSEKQTIASFSEFKGHRVLVAVQDGIVRYFIEECLKIGGAYYTLVNTEQCATKAVLEGSQQDDPYDFLIIDTSLPDINKKVLLDKMLETNVGQQLRVLSLGVATDSRMNQDMIDSQVCRHKFLFKPLSLKQFSDALLELASGQEAKQARVVDATGSLATTPRVLVVEDNRASQQVMQGMLEKLGYEMELAADGFEAIYLQSKDRFDAILMDCNLPRMDGFEATTRIRQLEEEGARIPIIALTANVEPVDVARCMDYGMDAHLEKPVTMKKLEACLNEWIKGNEKKVAEASISETSSSDQYTPIIHDFDATIDRPFLLELKSVIGSRFETMLQVFIEDTEQYLKELKSAVSDDNEEIIKRLAHTIKGSCRNLGLTVAADLAKRIEKSASGHAKDALLSLTDQLMQEYIKVVGALRQLDFEEPSRKANDTFANGEPLILVVDDDRSVRYGLLQVLEQYGYRVEQAEDGESALAICDRAQPDIVILDAVMPNMDGFEFCQKLRQREEFQHIPILMVTASENNNVIEQALRAGASDIVHKPISYSLLRQRIGRMIHASWTEKNAKYVTHHDVLTALPNRKLFIQDLEQAVKNARKNQGALGLICFGLDRFKLVNETLGHDVGDLLLKAVAERLQNILRNADVVGRLGGDEFGILLRRTNDRKIVKSVAQKVHDALEKPFLVAGHEIVLVASAGLATFPDDAMNSHDLLMRADTAMAQAKEQTADTLFYKKGMDEDVSRKLLLENALRNALTRSEFVLYYQAQVSAADRSLVGAEVLIRWHHPETGMVLPNEFIAMAEKTGLIQPIGEWVLKSACEQFVKWQQAGYQLNRVAVNVSSQQLFATSFTQNLEKILSETGMQAEHLTLELTESALLDQASGIVEVLHDLTAMGITLAIDDFGTGYSSLSYLKHLPVDVLKIDRCFISELEANHHDAAMVKGLINLAHGLGLKLVAEGVETEEQKQILIEYGCEYIQGYLISRPVSSELFQGRFLEGTKREDHSGDNVIPLRR